MKKINVLLLSLLLTVSTVFPSFAAQKEQYIFDKLGVLDGYEDELNEEAADRSHNTGMNIAFAAVKNCGEAEPADKACEMYEKKFGDEDGMLLLYAEDEGMISLYETDRLYDAFTGDDDDKMFDAFNDADTYEGGVSAYLETAETLLNDKGYGTSEQGEDGETVRAEEREFPRLMDDADLLTDDEEEELLAKLEEISGRQKFDVVIYTTDSLGNKTSEEFADDAFDYKNFGYGKHKDGILLLVSMEDRDYAISTHGSGIDYFTDEGLQYIVDDFVPDLSSEFYETAFNSFADLCDKFITQGKTGKPYTAEMLEDENRGSVSPFWIFGDAVIGLIIAFSRARKKKKELITATAQYDASEYTRDESVELDVDRDTYIGKKVSTRVIKKESSSSGGSSTHISSSGEEHGGTSGKF